MNSSALDYVVRAMVYIASRPASDYISGRIIAREIGVSTTYLSKILQILVQAGFLKSVTGPGGGFALARAPGDISLLEVMETVEGPLPIRQRCVLGLSDCSDANPCPFHGEWKKNRGELVRGFQKMTLAEALKKSWPLYRSGTVRARGSQT